MLARPRLLTGPMNAEISLSVFTTHISASKGLKALCVVWDYVDTD